MSDDPMADFLAREREALGEDADMFQSPTDITSATSPPAENGGNMDFHPVDAVANDVSSLALNDAVSPSTGNATPQADEASPAFSAQNVSATSGSFSSPQEDSGFIEEWRQKQLEVIAERDADSKKRHEETLEKAREDIDKFYDEYNEKKEKSINDNRANQEIELQQITTGNLWERVLRQIDLASKHVASQSSEADATVSPKFGNGPGGQNRAQSPFLQSQKKGVSGGSTRGTPANARDTTRMRELLQDLKKDPKAPGIEVKQ